MSIKNLSSEPTKEYQDINAGTIRAETIGPVTAQYGHNYSTSNFVQATTTAGHVTVTNGPTISQQSTFDIGISHPLITPTSVFLFTPDAMQNNDASTMNWMIWATGTGDISMRIRNVGVASDAYATFGYNFWIIP